MAEALGPATFSAHLCQKTPAYPARDGKPKLDIATMFVMCLYKASLLHTVAHRQASDDVEAAVSVLFQQPSATTGA